MITHHVLGVNLAVCGLAPQPRFGSVGGKTGLVGGILELLDQAIDIGRSGYSQSVMDSIGTQVARLTILDTSEESVGLALSFLPCLFNLVHDSLGGILNLLQSVLSDILGFLDVLVKVIFGWELADKHLGRCQLRQGRLISIA